jgi:hypothetical protein
MEENMKYMYIEKLPRGGYKIAVDLENGSREQCRYYGYTMKNAVKQFRIDYGYTRKRFTMIYT